MQISFPPNNVFGTLYADEVVTPLINTNGVDLLIQRDSVTQFQIESSYITPVRNFRLGAGTSILDSGTNPMIAQGGAGVSDIAEIHTTLIDSGGDVDLELRRNGATQFTLFATRSHFVNNIRLENARSLQDLGGYSLVSGDGLGHIDELGRIDAPITTPSESGEVTARPIELAPSTQSGTLDEETGTWIVTADDQLNLYLGSLLARMSKGASIRIEDITVYYNTDHNDVYFTYFRLNEHALLDATSSIEASGGANEALNDIGDDNFTLAVDYTLLTDKTYVISIGVESTAGQMTIYGIKITYQTV